MELKIIVSLTIQEEKDTTEIVSALHAIVEARGRRRATSLTNCIKILPIRKLTYFLKFGNRRKPLIFTIIRHIFRHLQKQYTGKLRWR